MELETAYFAEGCFWGVEETFRQVAGVTDVAVGYMGGTMRSPTYRDVCAGDTGHAEAVRVLFDPSAVTYEHLLDVFWSSHDPTQLNRQGPDVGAQYRSAIFTTTEAQQRAAEASRDSVARSGRYGRPVVTQIEPAGEFWMAEEYHQGYLRRRGLSSCRI